MTFRDVIPVRRLNPSTVSDYTEHRSDLADDFGNRCGYCNDIYIWRVASFEIDHFIPRNKNRRPFLTIKSPTDYSNLVYACRSCNNSKSNKWPTDDENLPNLNDEGFIDPCDTDFDLQFCRLDNGQIRPVTNLGSWMYNALKFYKPQHEVIYNIEQLDILIEESEDLLEKISDQALAEQIRTVLLNMYRNYKMYTKQLGTL
jgi:hypothetical protein